MILKEFRGAPVDAAGAIRFGEVACADDLIVSVVAFPAARSHPAGAVRVMSEAGVAGNGEAEALAVRTTPMTQANDLTHNWLTSGIEARVPEVTKRMSLDLLLVGLDVYRLSR